MKRRVIRWRENDRPCIDCGKPVRFGRTGHNRTEKKRCLMCEVKQSLEGWQYPVERRMRK